LEQGAAFIGICNRFMFLSLFIYMFILIWKSFTNKIDSTIFTALFLYMMIQYLNFLFTNDFYPNISGWGIVIIIVFWALYHAWGVDRQKLGTAKNILFVVLNYLLYVGLVISYIYCIGIYLKNFDVEKMTYFTMGINYLFAIGIIIIFLIRIVLFVLVKIWK